ncbi:MAG: hypothetical protein QHH01_05290 [Spirochaetales bacterium]|nr:hypothetical protein [Spirochaetales bacterium]
MAETQNALDPIVQEILKDARRRSERIIAKAQEDARAMEAATLAESKKRLEANRAQAAARIQAYRIEMLGRLPIEFLRMRTAYIDRALRAAVARAVQKLEPSILWKWYEPAIRSALHVMRGSPLILRCDSTMGNLLQALLMESGIDVHPHVTDLPGRAVLIETEDGSLHFSIDEHSCCATLLDRQRGRLAEALFPNRIPEEVTR